MSTQCKRDGAARLAEEAAAGQADEGDLRQSLFREVNEQIQNLNADWAVDAQDVVLCECRNRDCQEPIEITAAEYEAVRRFATRFLVKPGHADPECDRVVRNSRTYLIVEKVGPGAETAILLDRRRTKPRTR